MLTGLPRPDHEDVPGRGAAAGGGGGRRVPGDGAGQRDGRGGQSSQVPLYINHTCSVFRYFALCVDRVNNAISLALLHYI